MWMRIRAVPTGHLNKNLQMRSFLFKFHFSHTWLPSPKLKNVMNKQRRKIFGGNIMRFKFSGTSNQDQKCSSGSNVRLLCILFRIIHCEVIKSLSKCQGNNHGSHFSLHTVRLRFPLFIYWHGVGESRLLEASLNGTFPFWEPPVCDLNCSFLGHLSLIRSERIIFFYPRWGHNVISV